MIDGFLLGIGGPTLFFVLCVFAAILLIKKRGLGWPYD